ncbi:MAG TPA: helix-turn-helix domain-containing protein [Gemmataceae bacterium]|jgi:excisionase family DNA binding protein|nr:helix-turn-helix domain-containing protein [Gemmataceae bacterium]
MQFYTVPELKVLLKLSKSQVYGLIDGGKLRCHRFTRGKNGGIRVSQAQLDDYLKATEAGGETVPPETPRQVSPRRRRQGFVFLPPP